MPDSEQPAPRRFSEADVEKIVAKRLEERQQADIVAGLSKELNAIRREIGSANHLKREFGKQLADLNALVRAHVAQPMHTGTAEKFAEMEREFGKAEEEFGLDNLTPDERAAFPVVIRTVLASQKKINDQKTNDKEHAEEDARFWQDQAAKVAVRGHRLTLYALGLTAASVLMTILNAAGVFLWLRMVVFHLKG